jgi:phage gp46-like protein
MPDFVIQKNSDGIFDLVLENGDFKTDNSFNTALLMSFYIDARANESEMPRPELRRGWWGDLVNSDPTHVTGSKLWLICQARNIPTTLNSARNDAYNCTYWLIKNQNAVSIVVEGSQSGSSMGLQITVQAPSGETTSQYVKLWENTGNI